MKNSAIIQRDVYKVTGGNAVWLNYEQDPDTGDLLWVSADKWEEI